MYKYLLLLVMSDYCEVRWLSMLTSDSLQCWFVVEFICLSLHLLFVMKETRDALLTDHSFYSYYFVAMQTHLLIYKICDVFFTFEK